MSSAQAIANAAISYGGVSSHGGPAGPLSQHANTAASQADPGGAHAASLLGASEADLTEAMQISCSSSRGGCYVKGLLQHATAEYAEAAGGNKENAAAQGERRTSAFRISIGALQQGLVVSGPDRLRLAETLTGHSNALPADEVPSLVEALMAPLLAGGSQLSPSAAASASASGSGSPGSQSEAADRARDGAITALDELLPCLLTVASRSQLLHPGRSTVERLDDMSGAEYLEHVVQKLCRLRWPPAYALAITSLLKELPLDARQLRLVVRVSMKFLAEAPADTLPQYACQLFLLARRGHRHAVLSGVLDHMDALAATAGAAPAAAAAQRAVEGTVICHLNFAVKQDHDLGAALMRLARQPAADTVAAVAAPPPLTPFRAAALLSVASIGRFEQNVFTLLSDLLTDAFSHSRRAAASPWLEVPAAEASEGHAPVLLRQSLLAVVERSEGWEHLSGPLVDFATHLLNLDRASPQKSFAAAAAAATALASAKAPGTADLKAARCAHAAAVGEAILAATFSRHPASRTAVLRAVVDRVVSNSASAPRYVHALKTLCAAQPREVLGDGGLSAVKDALGYVGVLPADVSCRLLTAVGPLFQGGGGVLDAALLPLRKSMFAREATARIAAVEGLFTVLAVAAATNGTPGFAPEEGLAMLRRCLGQQREVRAAVHSGLCRLHGRCPGMRSAVEMLLSARGRQLFRLGAARAGSSGAAAGSDDDAQPLMLDACVDRGTASGGGGAPRSVDISEPLPVLLSALLAVAAAPERAGGGWHGATDDMRALFGTLRTSSLEDYGIDKNTSFTDDGCQDGDTCAGAVCRAALLSGCLEVAMAAPVVLAASPEALSADALGSVLDVFNLRTSLLQFVGVTPAFVSAGQAKKTSDRPAKKTAAAEKTKPAKGGAAAAAGKSDFAVRARECGGMLVGGVWLGFCRAMLDLLHEGGEDDEGEDGGGGGGAAADAALGRNDTLVEGAGGGDASKGESARAALRESTDFRRYVLQLTDAGLAQLAREDDPEALAEALPHLSHLAHVLLLNYSRMNDMGSAIDSAADADAAAAEAEGKPQKKGKSAFEKAPTGTSTHELAMRSLLSCLRLALRAGDDAGRLDRAARVVRQIFEIKEDGDSVFAVDAAAAMITRVLKNLIGDDDDARVTGTVCDLVDTLFALLPPGKLATHAKRFDKMCRGSSCADPKLAARVVSLMVAASGGPGAVDLGFLGTLSGAVRNSLGAYDQEAGDAIRVAFDVPETFVGIAMVNAPDEGDGKLAFKIKGKAAAPHLVADVVLDTASGVLDDIDYVLAALKKVEKDQIDKTKSKDKDVDMDEGEHPIVLGTGRLFRRLEAVCRATLPLLLAKAGCHAEKLVGNVARQYSTVCKLVQLLTKHKAAYGLANMESLLTFLSRTFTPKIYEFMQHFHNVDQHTGVSAAKLSRQSRILPNLVFQIEQVDVRLISLAKASKGAVDETRWLQRSTARDFRIDAGEVEKLQGEAQKKIDKRAKAKAKAAAGGGKRKKTAADDEDDGAAEKPKRKRAAGKAKAASAGAQSQSKKRRAVAASDEDDDDDDGDETMKLPESYSDGEEEDQDAYPASMIDDEASDDDDDDDDDEL